MEAEPADQRMFPRIHRRRFRPHPRHQIFEQFFHVSLVISFQMRLQSFQVAALSIPWRLASLAYRV